MKKIVFMGTPDFSVKILEKLASKHDIIAVFTQPDRPSGRGQTLTPPPVKMAASALNIPTILQPTTLKSGEALEFLKRSKPDFIVVAAYAMLLPESVLNIAPCINLHASILPDFRGASPIQSAVLRGDITGGITAIRMAKGLDTGDMLGFCAQNIKDKSAAELFCIFSELASELALKVIADFDKIAPLKQADALASKCGKIKKQSGLIDFKNESAKSLFAKFLAYHPWPGLFLSSGLKIIDIARPNDEISQNDATSDSANTSKNPAKGAAIISLGSDTADAAKNPAKGAANAPLNPTPGQIIQILDDGIKIALKSGAIIIKFLQEPGKKAMPSRDFLNGKRLKIGDIIS